MENGALLEGLNEAQRGPSPPTPRRSPSSPAPGRARPGCSPAASPTGASSARPTLGHVLALTFTRKAAGELQARLRRLGLRDDVAAGTFHAVAYAQLRRSVGRPRHAAAGAARPQGPVVCCDLLGPDVVRAGASTSSARSSGPRPALVTPDDYRRGRSAAGRQTSARTDARWPELYERYEDREARQRQVDFDDLLGLCVRAIETDATFAAAQRWRFRHCSSTSSRTSTRSSSACLRPGVGDVATCAWSATRTRPSTPGTAPILDCCRDLSRLVAGTSTVALERQLPVVAPDPRHRQPRAGLGRGPRPAVRVPLVPTDRCRSIRSMADDRSEARGIARAVLDRHRPGAAWSHQAVLTRTNAQTVLIAEACRSARRPVPRPGPASVSRAARGARGPPRDAASVERRSTEHLAALEERLSASERPGRSRCSDAELDRDAQPRGALAPARPSTRSADPPPTVAGFVAWLSATVGRDDAGGPGDAVELATFHAAKGLEWPIVHLAGLEDGLVPIGHARTEEAVAEERRLFYVAVTRAERELRMTWAAERTFGAKVVRRRPSPYLDRSRAAVRRADGRSGSGGCGAIALGRARDRPRGAARTRTSRPSGPPDIDPARSYRCSTSYAHGGRSGRKPRACRRT